jgi:hypothetical protein
LPAEFPVPEGGRTGRANQWEFLLGAWLSLVERFVRDEEVAGSNPVAPKLSPQALRSLKGHDLEELFSRFSPASGRVLRAAEQECRNHNHYYVGVEHLLVALLEEQDGAVLERLRAEEIDPAEVHAELRRALGTGEDRLWEGILVTPRVRKVVALAEERAGEHPLDPIDLFEAIRAEGGSLAAELLRRAQSRNTATASE